VLFLVSRCCNLPSHSCSNFPSLSIYSLSISPLICPPCYLPLPFATHLCRLSRSMLVVVAQGLPSFRALCQTTAATNRPREGGRTRDLATPQVAFILGVLQTAFIVNLRILITTSIISITVALLSGARWRQ
jgi:hypothetical protein